MEIVAKENLVSIQDHEDGQFMEHLVADPITTPQKIMDNWSPQLIEDLPNIFCGNNPSFIISIYFCKMAQLQSCGTVYVI
jgi:hypothetical protein